jgi:hypothetical protein
LKAVIDRKVTSIVWRQSDARQIELVSADGEIETVTGTHADAEQMAGDADMRLVASPLGIVRWTRELPSKRGRTPKRIGPWLSS